MNLKGAIFDMDGTLLNSMHVWYTLASTYLCSRGIAPKAGVDSDCKHMSMNQAAEYLRTNYGLTDSSETIANGVNKIIEHQYFEVFEAKAGVPETLSAMKNAGVRMCIATASDRYLAEAALKRLGLLDYFEAVFTCTEVGWGKDTPKIFEDALAFLGTNKDNTIIFEDALYAVKTAKDAGFKVAAIADDSAADSWDEIVSLSDYQILSYENWSIENI